MCSGQEPVQAYLPGRRHGKQVHEDRAMLEHGLCRDN
jgi:hypothetical protein